MATELVPSGDNCLHILQRSAQFRRTCFLNELAHLVRGHASDDLRDAWALLVAVDGLAHSLAFTRRASTAGGET